MRFLAAVGFLATLCAGTVTACGLLGGSDSKPPVDNMGSGGVRACVQGDETCPCYPNNSCNAGLVCASGRCVSLGGGSGGTTVSPGSGGTTVSPGSGGTTVNPGSGGSVTSGSGGSVGTGTGGARPCTTGDEGCGCYPNNTCNGTLTCASQLCVNVGGGSGGRATSGTGGTVSAGTGGAPAGTGGAAPPANLVDDFRDCDGSILENQGRKGPWYNLNATGSTLVFGPAPSTSWGDQSCGAYLTGACPGCDVAGVGVILAPGSYDLRSYLGFRVSYESGAALYIAVKTTNGSNFGYARSARVAPTGAPGTGSMTRTINFADLTPDATYHGLQWVSEFHFTIDDASKQTGFGLGIHRLELF
jgi:hypothetical protein